MTASRAASDSKKCKDIGNAVTEVGFGSIMSQTNEADTHKQDDFDSKLKIPGS